MKLVETAVVIACVIGIVAGSLYIADHINCGKIPFIGAVCVSH
jgi:hypothetical protein